MEVCGPYSTMLLFPGQQQHALPLGLHQGTQNLVIWTAWFLHTPRGSQSTLTREPCL